MKRKVGEKWVVGVSGGPDSVYLLHSLRDFRDRLVIAHLNHGARGRASERDMEFVERLGKRLGIAVRTGRATGLSKGSTAAPGFEERARDARTDFLLRTRAETGATKVLVAHTADDQVETVLMRILHGAGVSGLKGIPRRTADGIERPLLDTWREEILAGLERQELAFRTDASNRDTRFERNWIRHVLIPLLERRYGKAVKARIFALGERFREIDAFLDTVVRRWMTRHVKKGPGAGAALRVPRAAYAGLPEVVRKKIVQVLCFERMGVVPNERLIESADKVLVSGKPSARLDLGRGASLVCRYKEAVFRPREARDAPAADSLLPGTLIVRKVAGKPATASLRRRISGEREAVFDADGISGPFSVRPLRAGDRIRPFGAPGTRKIKDILIDRKVPREERWGRPVVCDGRGEIVWVPGLVRSWVAPVTPKTRRTVVLAVRNGGAT